jgi:hypothetical protein
MPRRASYPQQADFDLARAQQRAEERAGRVPRPLADVLAGKLPTVSLASAADLTARQLRRRGHFGQAALLADQGALLESDAERAGTARAASVILKGLARRPPQLEFDFFMGNVSLGHQYHDTVLSRLRASEAPASEQRTALAVLGLVVRWLGWQTYACEKACAAERNRKVA